MFSLITEHKYFLSNSFRNLRSWQNNAVKWSKNCFEIKNTAIRCSVDKRTFWREFEITGNIQHITPEIEWTREIKITGMASPYSRYSCPWNTTGKLLQNVHLHYKTMKILFFDFKLKLILAKFFLYNFRLFTGFFTISSQLEWYDFNLNYFLKKIFFMKKGRFGKNRHLTLQINISCLTQTPFWSKLLNE